MTPAVLAALGHRLRRLGVHVPGDQVHGRRSLPPFLAMGIRFLLAGTVLLVAVLALRGPGGLPDDAPRRWSPRGCRAVPPRRRQRAGRRRRAGRRLRAGRAADRRDAAVGGPAARGAARPAVGGHRRRTAARPCRRRRSCCCPGFSGAGGPAASAPGLPVLVPVVLRHRAVHPAADAGRPVRHDGRRDGRRRDGDGAARLLGGEWGRLDVAASTPASWIAFAYLVLVGSVVGLQRLRLAARPCAAVAGRPRTPT